MILLHQAVETNGSSGVRRTLYKLQRSVLARVPHGRLSGLRARALRSAIRFRTLRRTGGKLDLARAIQHQ